jgi:hypothetical protein
MIIDPLHTMHAQQLRDKWQARILAENKGRAFVVALAIIAKRWPEALEILLRVVFESFRDIGRPFIRSRAIVQKDGSVIAEVVPRIGPPRWQIVYDSEAEMVKEFRDIADRLRLDDAERVEMTETLKMWVAADRRVDFNGERHVA